MEQMRQQTTRQTTLAKDDLHDSWFGRTKLDTVRLVIEERVEDRAVDPGDELDDPWFQ